MTPDIDLQELMTEGFSQLSRMPARVSLRSHETVPLRVVIVILLFSIAFFSLLGDSEMGWTSDGGLSAWYVFGAPFGWPKGLRSLAYGVSSGRYLFDM